MATTDERVFTRDFALAFAANFSALLGFYVLLATLPTFVIELGQEESAVGLILGTLALTAVVVRPIAGKVADARGTRVLLLAGPLLTVIATTLYAFVHRMPPFLGVRLLHGAGFAIFSTAISVLVATLAPHGRRGEAIGFFGMSTSLAMAAGPATGVVFAERFGYQALFVLSAVLSLVAGVTASLVRTHHVGQRGVSLWPTPREVVLPAAVMPAVVAGISALTYASLVSFLPVYAVKHGMGNPGWFFFAYAVVVAVSRGPLGRLSDRVGRTRVVAPGLVATAVALLALALSPTLPMMLVVAGLYGLGAAAVQPTLMALTIDRAKEGEQGRAMGTFTMSFDLAIGVGSLAWGLVAEHWGYEIMYLMASNVALIGLVVLVQFAHRPRSARA